MARVISDLLYRLRADDKEFNQKMKGASATLKAVGDKMQQIGKKLTLGLTLPIVGVGTAMVKLASDTGESLNAVNKVFGESSQVITDWGDNAVKQAGLTAAEFNQSAAVTGALLTNMGASADEAAKQTIDLTKRAADMASIFNTDVNDALTAIQSAIRGESEPIRRFAVSLNESATAAEAVRLGLAESEKEVSDYAKSQARLSLILQQTASFAGDFEQTSGDLANGTRVLKAEVKELAADMGKQLLPIVNSVVKALRDAVGWFSNLSDEQKKMILTLAGIAAAAGPVIAAIGGISKAISFLAANPAVLAIGAIAALTAGLVAIGAAKEKARIEEYTEDIREMAEAAGVASDAVSDLAKDLHEIASMEGMALLRGFDDIKNLVSETAKKYGITNQEAVKLIRKNEDLSDVVEKVLELHENDFKVMDGLALLEERRQQNQEQYKNDMQEIASLQSDAYADALAKAQAEWDAARALEAQNQLIRDQLKQNKEDAWEKRNREREDAFARNELGITNEIELTQDLIRIQQEYVDSLFENDVRTLDTYNGHIDKLNELKAKLEEMQAYQSEYNENEQTYAEGRAEMMAEINAAEAEALEARQQAYLDFLKAQEEAAQRADAAEKQRIQNQLTLAQNLYSSLSTLTGAYFDYKMRMTSEDEEKQKKIALEQFYINKALQVANIAINTAAAVIGFLANPGGVYGTVLSGIAAATGAIQAGIVAATPPPAFANGVENFLVPPGYPNDSFPIMVQSGESVTVKTPEQQRAGEKNVTVNINNTLNTDTDANMQRAARMLVPYIKQEELRSG